MSRTRRFSQNPFSRIAYIIMSSLLLGFFLAACGTNTTTSGQATSTPTAQTVNCGSLHGGPGGISSPDKVGVQNAENCFYQAFQQCRPATLTFTAFGVDAGAIHHFSVKSVNGSCTVSDGWQHYIAPNPPGATINYTCATVTKQSDGLHIQTCGDLGTILIPAS